jgi:hypothetical protein
LPERCRFRAQVQLRHFEELPEALAGLIIQPLSFRTGFSNGHYILEYFNELSYVCF